MTGTTLQRVIISGGGTGGHIFPAIAIADAVKSRYPSCEILFVGARGRMEMEKVPAAGYPIEGLWISGLQRKLSLNNLSFPFKLLSSLRRAGKILKRFQPQVAIGVGGYASGPLLWKANAKKIPTVIQEQNSYPGITNKLLARKADRICVAYPGMDKFFPPAKLVLTGNPVREHIKASNVTREEGREHFNLDQDKPTIAVLGGSLGARTINQSIACNLAKLDKAGHQLIWQCGRMYYDQYKGLSSTHIRVVDFIKDMEMAYAAADIIIARAGALTISELCLVGKPVILVPSPNVAEDHQTHNAMALVDNNAAVLVRDKDAEEQLVSKSLELLADREKQKLLSDNIKKMAKPDAAQHILAEIERVVKNGRSL